MPIKTITIALILLLLPGLGACKNDDCKAPAESNVIKISDSVGWLSQEEGWDKANYVQVLDNGHFIIAGTSTPNLCLMEVDQTGEKHLFKTYSGPKQLSCSAFNITNDGGYIIVGHLHPYDVSADVWIVKTDSSGDMEWETLFSESFAQEACSVQQMYDGRYVITGKTNSSPTVWNAWLLILDSQGNIVQKNTIREHSYITEGSYQVVMDSIQTDDGNFIIVGHSGPDLDGWIAKIDIHGEEIWNKTYGGIFADVFRSVEQTSDGGYIIVGNTNSFGDGDKACDALIMKIDSEGNMQWNRTFDSGTKGFVLCDVMETHDEYYLGMNPDNPRDDGFIAVGYNGSDDGYIVKLNSRGRRQWDKIIGGTDVDTFTSVHQVQNGDYIIAGLTYSFDAEFADAWLVQIDPDGKIR